MQPIYYRYKMPLTSSKRTSVQLEIINLDEEGFHPLLNIKVFGKKFKLVLDTGASKTAFDHQLLLKAFEKAVLKLSDKLSTGLGTSTMQSSTVTITDFQISRLLIDPFEVAVLDLSPINAAYSQMGHPEVLGVLGGDVLVKYQAVIDYGKGTLVLKK